MDVFCRSEDRIRNVVLFLVMVGAERQVWWSAYLLWFR